MTSQLRRKIAERIFAILAPNEKVIEKDHLAAEMQFNAKTEASPELHLSLDALSKINGSFDVHKLISQLHYDPVNSVKISNNVKPFLVITFETRKLFKEILGGIMTSYSDLWKNNVNFHNIEKQTVIVEFSSPNIAKPFHTGHLRSTILGNFTANIYERVGHKVIRMNYLGDWGSQFGVLAKGYHKFGNEKSLKENPIHHLFEVYVKANQLLKHDSLFYDETRQEFKNLEKGQEPVISLWKQFRQLSIEDLNKTYERLRVKFDEYEGESMYSETAVKLCDKLGQNGLLFSKDDGSQVLEYTHPGGCRTVPLRKSDGTTLYLTRDLAAAIKRMDKYNFGKMIYVVENGQSDHFIAIFDILRRMGFHWYRHLSHVKFGRIQGMSTREGNVVFLTDILDEAKARTMVKMQQSKTTKINQDFENVADVLGTSAVIVNDMRSRRLSDFKFDWNRIIQMKGDTGIFIQYVHARLCSLEENCGISLVENCDFEQLNEMEALNLLSLLSRYEEVCSAAYHELEPCHIVQYLFKLGHYVNGAFHALKVKGEAQDVAQARLKLFVAVRHILADGMQTLGLKPLMKM